MAEPITTALAVFGVELNSAAIVSAAFWVAENAALVNFAAVPCGGEPMQRRQHEAS